MDPYLLVLSVIPVASCVLLRAFGVDVDTSAIVQVVVFLAVAVATVLAYPGITW